MLGEVRSRINGKNTQIEAPYRISEKIQFKDMLVVIPFILKGKIDKILNKGRNSPFLGPNNSTPICEPEILRES